MKGLVEKKLIQLTTLQELIFKLEDNSDEVSNFQRREMGGLLQEILNQIPALATDEKGR